jgi:superfamily II DNA or RNA helicase
LERLTSRVVLVTYYDQGDGVAVELRGYQKQAVSAVANAYQSGLHRVGVQLPTGAGKTVVFCDMAYKTYLNGRRVLIVLHRDELILQTVRKIQEAGIANRDIGVVKAGRNEVHQRVVIASIHTLRTKERLSQIQMPDLTIVDEAHVSVSPTYLRLFEHIDALPGGKGFLAGFTATWVRSDSRGLGDIWQKVVFKRSLRWAIDNGFLVEPKPLQLGGSLDMSNVRVGRDGDYNEADLGQVVMVNDLRDIVVRGYHAVTPGRQAVLFAPTQASARFFAEAFKESGVTVAEIFAGTKPSTRRWNLDGFRKGGIKILVTCTALAEGWDAPWCDTAILVRPTKHVGLFIQQVGRVLRTWPGKTEAHLLDFVGVLDDKDFRAAVDLHRSPEPGEEEFGVCGECGALGPTRYVTDADMDLCRVCAAPYMGGESVPMEYTAKKIEGVTHIDLFENATARWLRTSYGVPFVSTRKHIYFIVPINGLWNVGVSGTRYQLAGGRWLAEGVSATDAMDIGGEAALNEDPTISHKKASWRQGNRAPTDEQRALATKLGIDTSGMSKAAVSDAIDVAQADRTLGIYRNTEIAV